MRLDCCQHHLPLGWAVVNALWEHVRVVGRAIGFSAHAALIAASSGSPSHHASSAATNAARESR